MKILDVHGDHLGAQLGALVDEGRQIVSVCPMNTEICLAIVGGHVTSAVITWRIFYQ